MSALSLLRNEGDWDDYQRMYDGAQFPGAKIDWGKGPESYPCLVASHFQKSSMLTAAKVVSCYVYVADAKKLIEANTIMEPTLEDVDKPIKAEILEVVDESHQKNFNKSMLAHCMAIADILVRTSIIKPKQYADVYAKMLAITDQRDMDGGEVSFEDVLGKVEDDEPT